MSGPTLARSAATRWVAACLCATLLTGVVPASAFAISPPRVTAPAATLTTENDVRLWSRKSTKPRAVASTIKMLNALVVIDNAELTEVVTVPKKAAAINDGDVGLRTGQKLTVRQLLEIMMVVSANDAAEALAIHIAGSEKAYVKLMNAKAAQLGLAGTKAADPHGLSKRERSTARDLAVLGRVVRSDPTLGPIVKKRSVLVPRKNGKSVRYSSTNHLLGRYKGLEGVKTGYTRASGFCLVTTAKRGDVRLVAVVMGAKRNDGTGGRFDQTRKLLDWGFKHTHMKTLTSTESTYSVPASFVDTTTTVVARPAWKVRTALLDGTKLTRTVDATGVVLPVLAGQRLGVLKVRASGKVIATVPLVSTSDVAMPPALKQPLP